MSHKKDERYELFGVYCTGSLWYIAKYKTLKVNRIFMRIRNRLNDGRYENFIHWDGSQHFVIKKNGETHLGVIMDKNGEFTFNSGE